ncbi:MAG: hypothetical protein D9V46_04690 [Deltaproteobacteria bacterium]|uniref:hypothetical protein n=1 Tax=Hydrosulfovibrio ferrireducens TaxID=2934181 RepID=UPI001213CF8C|nr:MAG: hypothetical protein D9V46_04690 [Deltaproteobacteria bacterium]
MNKMKNQPEQLFNIAIKSLPESTTSLIDLFSALLTPTIALIMVYIAYQQYKVNEQRLKHETYENRIKIYKSVNKFISQITANGHPTYTECHIFYSEASEAAFLFNSKIITHIEDLYQKGIDLSSLQEELYPSDGSKGIEVGEERTSISQQKSILFKWFVAQLEVSQKLFTAEIGLKK